MRAGHDYSGNGMNYILMHKTYVIVTIVLACYQLGSATSAAFLAVLQKHLHRKCCTADKTELCAGIHWTHAKLLAAASGAKPTHLQTVAINSSSSQGATPTPMVLGAMLLSSSSFSLCHWFPARDTGRGMNSHREIKEDLNIMLQREHGR